MTKGFRGVIIQKLSRKLSGLRAVEKKVRKNRKKDLTNSKSCDIIDKLSTESNHKKRENKEISKNFEKVLDKLL